MSRLCRCSFTLVPFGASPHGALPMRYVSGGCSTGSSSSSISSIASALTESGSASSSLSLSSPTRRSINTHRPSRQAVVTAWPEKRSPCRFTPCAVITHGNNVSQQTRTSYQYVTIYQVYMYIYTYVQPDILANRVASGATPGLYS